MTPQVASIFCSSMEVLIWSDVCHHAHLQVTSIFGSSMEVLICVDGESPGGSAAADAAVAHDTRRGGAEHGTGNGDGAGGSASGVFHCGSAFATVVSVAGPWPPVAVPVPFRLQPSSDVERLRCEASPLVAAAGGVHVGAAKVSVQQEGDAAPDLKSSNRPIVQSQTVKSSNLLLHRARRSGGRTGWQCGGRWRRSTAPPWTARPPLPPPPPWRRLSARHQLVRTRRPSPQAHDS